MQYHFTADVASAAALDFVPTLAIGFYRLDAETLFENACHELETLCPGISIMGCSSDEHIEAQAPHRLRENSHDYLFALAALDMEAFSLHAIPSSSAVDAVLGERELGGCSALAFFSGCRSDALERTIAQLKARVGASSLFGAVAADTLVPETSGSLYGGGAFMRQGCVVLLVDQSRYRLRGMNLTDFDAVGFGLRVTRADGNTVMEIENAPALPMLQTIAGGLSDEGFRAFEYPLFLTRQGHETLAAVRTVDRQRGYLQLYRRVDEGDSLRIAISQGRASSERKMNRLAHYRAVNGFSLLFLCTAFRRYWGETEAIYLTYLSRQLGVNFIGMHTHGEVTPGETEKTSLLWNQTLMLLTIETQGGE
jgi:hypothetical protein